MKKRNKLFSKARIIFPVAVALGSITGCRKEKEVVTVYSTNVIFVDTVAVPLGSIADGEGNIYSTIYVGAQRWMAENLRTSRYSNGDPISFAPGAVQWGASGSGSWCYYEGDAGYNVFHGKLYNWYVVQDPRNVCPNGWHVPSDADWKELELVIGIPMPNLNSTGSRGAEANAGGQLKSLIMWDNPNIGATDSLGFAALPGGSRFTTGLFDQGGAKGYWWTSSGSDAVYAWQRSLANDNAGVFRFVGAKTVGASVRCLED